MESWSQSRALMSHDFLSNFSLFTTHLITGSSNIISSENLAEKQPFWAEKTVEFLEFPLYTTKYNPSGTLSNTG